MDILNFAIDNAFGIVGCTLGFLGLGGLGYAVVFKPIDLLLLPILKLVFSKEELVLYLIEKFDNTVIENLKEKLPASGNCLETRLARLLRKAADKIEDIT